MRVLLILLSALLFAGCVAPTAAPAQPTPAPAQSTPAPGATGPAGPTATAGPRPSVTPIPAVAQFLPGARFVAQWNTPQIPANAPHFGYVRRAGSRATLQRFEIARPDAEVTTVDVLRVNTQDTQTYATELMGSEVSLYTDCAGPDSLSDNDQVFGATCINRARQSIDMLVGYNEVDVFAVTLINAEPSGETANNALHLIMQLLGF